MHAWSYSFECTRGRRIIDVHWIKLTNLDHTVVNMSCTTLIQHQGWKHTCALGLQGAELVWQEEDEKGGEGEGWPGRNHPNRAFHNLKETFSGKCLRRKKWGLEKYFCHVIQALEPMHIWLGNKCNNWCQCTAVEIWMVFGFQAIF